MTVTGNNNTTRSAHPVDVQIATTNATVNQFLNTRQPSWMLSAGGQPVKQISRPMGSRRSSSHANHQQQQDRSQKPPVNPQPAAQPQAQSVLPSPAPSDEPSPRVSNPVDSPNVTSASLPEPQTIIIAPSIPPNQPTTEARFVHDLTIDEEEESSTLEETNANRASVPPPPRGPTVRSPNPIAAPFAALQLANESREGVPSSGNLPSPAAPPVRSPSLNRSDLSEGPPPAKRQRQEFIQTRPVRFSPLLRNIERFVGSQGGDEVFSADVERPRLQLLKEACLKEDGFFLLLHQLFVIWSQDRDKVHRLLPLADVKVLDTAFQILEQILKKNDAMPARTQRFFQIFPIGDFFRLDEYHLKLLAQIKSFLDRMVINFSHLMHETISRRYPVLVDELLTHFYCLSPTLQRIIFTACRRRLGVLDGVLGTEMDRLFKEDQQERNPNGTFMIIPDMSKSAIEQRNGSRIATYRSIQARARAARDTRMAGQGPAQVGRNPNNQGPPLAGTPSLQSPSVPHSPQGPWSTLPQMPSQQVQASNFPSTSLSYSSPSVAQGMVTSPQVSQGFTPSITSVMQVPSNLVLSGNTTGQASYPPYQPYHPQQQPQQFSPGVAQQPYQFQQGLVQQQQLMHHRRASGQGQPPQFQQQQQNWQAIPNQQQNWQAISNQQQQQAQQQQLQQAQLQMSHQRQIEQMQNQLAQRPSASLPTTPGYLPQMLPPQPWEQQPPRDQIRLQQSRERQWQRQSQQHQNLNIPNTPLTMAPGGSPTMTSNTTPVSNVRVQNVARQILPMPVSSPTLPAAVQGGRDQATRQAKNQGMDQLFFPSLEQRIPRQDWPYSSTDFKSLQMALHQAPSRSPKRVVRNPKTNNNGQAQRYYQAVKCFALAPTYIARANEMFTHEFVVADEQIQQMSSILQGRDQRLPISQHHDHSLRWRMRAGRGISTEAPTESQWVVTESRWPTNFFSTLNTKVLDVRRHPHAGKDLPTELTQLVRTGKNELSVSMGRPLGRENEGNFFVAVEVLETIAHTTAVDLIKGFGMVSKVDALAIIRKRLGRDSGDDDDVLPLTSNLSIKLADPFSSVIFDVPVRGVHCRHLECFDLENWLNTRPSKEITTCGHGYGIPCACPKTRQPSDPDKWRCPLCDEDARPYSLRIDEFLLEVRDKLKEQGKLKAKCIEVKEDGTWTAQVEEDDMDDDSGDDDGEHPAPRRSVSSRPTGTSMPPGSASRQGSRAQPEVIVLDDE